MRRFVTVVALAFTPLLPSAVAMQAAAQGGETDSIDIAYIDPSNEDLRPAYQLLTRLRVLEQLKVLLSPLELPRRLQVKADQCGDANTVTYEPGAAVTICYEYVKRIQDTAPQERSILIGPGALTGDNWGYLPRDDLIVGPIVLLTLSQSALGIFDLLDVPVWGNQNEAANRLAGYLMTQFGQRIAWKTLMGAAWYLAQTTMTGAGVDFSYVRAPEARRFYNLLCMAYASDPKSYAFLAKNADIPSNRLDRCEQDFVQVQAAFDATILPHVDQILLQKVRAMPWLPPPAR
jgi:putative metallopeptidase DUF4344